MPTTYEGDFRTPQGQLAIVAARFNRFIVEELLGSPRRAAPSRRRRRGGGRGVGARFLEIRW
jgi:6,7-dimethyl-8-ribityllumazine synthase